MPSVPTSARPAVAVGAVAVVSAIDLLAHGPAAVTSPAAAPVLTLAGVAAAVAARVQWTPLRAVVALAAAQPLLHAVLEAAGGHDHPASTPADHAPAAAAGGWAMLAVHASAVVIGAIVARYGARSLVVAPAWARMLRSLARPVMPWPLAATGSVLAIALAPAAPAPRHAWDSRGPPRSG